MKMKKVTLEVTVPEEVWRRATVEAAGGNQTLNAMVADFLTDVSKFDEERSKVASKWIRRWSASKMPENTFLQYALKTGKIEDVLDTHDYIQDRLEDLKENDPEDCDEIKVDIVHFKEYLCKIYARYTEKVENYEDKTLAAAMARFFEWRKKKWDLVEQKKAEHL